MAGRARLPLFLLILAFSAHAWSCTGRCTTQLDCPSGEFCDPNDKVCAFNCQTDAECQQEICDALSNCLTRGTHCSGDGRCKGDVRFRAPVPEVRPDRRPGGWDLPALGARAMTFVFDDLGVAPAQVGFDLDQSCPPGGTAAGCVDNGLARLGAHANGPMSAGVRSGSTLVLFQIAGLDAFAAGTSTIVTAKLYAGLDSDGRPENNVQSPAADDPCCRLLVASDSLSGEQARARSPITVKHSAQTGDTFFLSARSNDSLELTLVLTTQSRVSLRLAQAQITGHSRSASPGRIRGVLGGALTIRSMAETANPFCTTTAGDVCPSGDLRSSLIEGIANQLQPDVDLDRDGLETFVLQGGRIVRCLDGNRRVVPPVQASDPASCARDPSMADGYSIAFEFSAVRAELVGIQ